MFGDAPVERFEQRGLVHQSAAAEGDQHRAGLHRRQERAVHHAGGVRRQRQAQDHHVSRPKQPRNLARRGDGVGRRVRTRRAPNPGDASVEGARLAGHRLADRAEADDQPVRVGHLAERQPRPAALGLRRAPLRPALEVVEDAGQHIFRNTDRLAVVGGQPRALADDLAEHRMVEPRRPALHPGQARRFQEDADIGLDRRIAIEVGGDPADVRRGVLHRDARAAEAYGPVPGHHQDLEPGMSGDALGDAAIGGFVDQDTGHVGLHGRPWLPDG